MRNRKRMLAVLLAAAMSMAQIVPLFAAEPAIREEAETRTEAGFEEEVTDETPQESDAGSKEVVSADEAASKEEGVSENEKEPVEVKEGESETGAEEAVKAVDESLEGVLSDLKVKATTVDSVTFSFNINTRNINNDYGIIFTDDLSENDLFDDDSTTYIDYDYLETDQYGDLVYVNHHDIHYEQIMTDKMEETEKDGVYGYSFICHFKNYQGEYRPLKPGTTYKYRLVYRDYEDNLYFLTEAKAGETPYTFTTKTVSDKRDITIASISEKKGFFSEKIVVSYNDPDGQGVSRVEVFDNGVEITGDCPIQFKDNRVELGISREKDQRSISFNLISRYKDGDEVREYKIPSNSFPSGNPVIIPAFQPGDSLSANVYELDGYVVTEASYVVDYKESGYDEEMFENEQDFIKLDLYYKPSQSQSYNMAEWYYKDIIFSYPDYDNKKIEYLTRWTRSVGDGAGDLREGKYNYYIIRGKDYNTKLKEGEFTAVGSNDNDTVKNLTVNRIQSWINLSVYIRNSLVWEKANVECEFLELNGVGRQICFMSRVDGSEIEIDGYKYTKYETEGFGLYPGVYKDCLIRVGGIVIASGLEFEVKDANSISASIDPSNLTVNQSETATLTAIHTPENAGITSNGWSVVSGNDIVSITPDGDRCKVTGLKAGTATVQYSVTAENGSKATATCKITVKYTPVTGVTLSPKSVSINAGESKALTASIAPENASVKKLIWTTADDKVATVNAQGVVTALAEGKTTVTVKTEDGGFTDSCAVTVYKTPLTGMTLDKDKLQVNVGGTGKINPVFTPANASNKSVTWTSSDNKIATVANGVVTGVAEGTTVITARSAEGGFEAKCVVTVVPSEVKIYTVTFVNDTSTQTVYVRSGEAVKKPADPESKLEFLGWYNGNSQWNFSMPVTEDITLTARFLNVEEVDATKPVSSGLDSAIDTEASEITMVKGQTAELGNGQWEADSESKKIISIGKTNGKLKAKKAGTATVTGKNEAGADKIYKLTVIEPAVTADGKEKTTKYSMTVGNTASFKLLQTEGKTLEVTWISSNPKIASVDEDGKVTALAKGSTKVSAYISGVPFTCNVSVSDVNKITQLSLDDKIVINPMQSVTLKYDKTQFKLKNIVWSDDSGKEMQTKTSGSKVTYYFNDVVRATPSGKITAVGPGSTTLYGDNGSAKVTLKVTVNEVANRSVVYVTKGKSEKITFLNVKNAAAKWESSDTNETYLALKDGKVTAKAYTEEPVVITCKYNKFDESKPFTFTTRVYVEDPSFKETGGLKKLTSTQYSLTLKAGKAYVIKTDKVWQTLVYSSSKKNIGFVDENGIIYARKAGNTVISTKINGKTFKIKLKVE